MASVWSGHLTFGLVSMPVRLHSGARSQGISFNMLHRTDNARLKQQYVCQGCGELVTRDEIVKGFEFRKDEYVVIEPEDIKRIEPESSKVIEILEFVSANLVDPIFLESSYYIMPEEAGKKPYVLLERALDATGKLAVAKLSMHNREYTLVIRPLDGGLAAHTLYYEDEIRKVEGFGLVQSNVSDHEIKQACMLISALEGIWEPSKYQDTFQENMKRLIESKLLGEEIATPELKKKEPVADLMAAIKQSLEAIEKKKEEKGKKRKEGKRN